MHVAHRSSRRGGIRSDSLFRPHIPNVYQINVEMSSSRRIRACKKFGGYMNRRDIDEGLLVLEWDMADHCHHTISVHTTAIAYFLMVSL